jgi:hypothetical protein
MPETNQPVDDSYGTPDAENPEWTKERFARARRSDELPEGLRNKLSAIQDTARIRKDVLIPHTT